MKLLRSQQAVLAKLRWHHNSMIKAGFTPPFDIGTNFTTKTVIQRLKEVGLVRLFDSPDRGDLQQHVTYELTKKGKRESARLAKKLVSKDK